VLAPSLQRFDDVPLDAGVLQKHPSLVDEESLEGSGNLPVGDDGIRAVQDIEKKGLENFRIVTDSLEIEALEL